jgi:TolA-binding protein
VEQLKAMLAEKNAKIAMITAEFDSHRADFRSTLDTLELASTETERVYEKRVEDLLEERRLLTAQGDDVESVAQQLRQLEEVVQELEEGLEDARRGEAEARGEVEFLRGEVERVRAELRREREKNAAVANGVKEPAPLPKAASPAPAALSEPASSPTPTPTTIPAVVNRAPSPAPAAAPTPAPAAAGGDEEKWCALCEQDGHDSISCPYDN